jgi:putative CocE/NonD family hydrolase
MGQAVEVVRRRGLVATMPDGVDLVADAWHPAAGGPWPVLLQRLPYGRVVASAPVLVHPAQLARAGYAVVSQDVRGRGDSGGTFDPFVAEAADGAASVAWAAGLPFCDGQVATFGFSYQGMAQLLAAAERPAALRAIAPMQCAAGAYDGWTYDGGCLQLPFAGPWAAQLAGQEPGAAPPPVDLAALPLAGALGDTPPRWWGEWLDHPTADAYWARRTADLAAVAVPAFAVAGWHDTFAAATCRLISALGAEAVLGPWAHIPWGTRLGDVELGPEAGPGVAHRALVAFFDRVLKDRGDPPGDAAVRYYTGGIGWRAAPVWPPPAVAIRRWTATSGGDAPSRHGDGRLVPGPADAGPADVLVAEPLDPVPAGLVPLSDEFAVEDRRSVLCYTSEPLGAPVVVTGQPAVTVRSVADVATHDVVASLTMVEPSGRSTRLATGARRLRDLRPGEPAETRIELGPTSWLVPAGHRLRLDLSASRFPAYDRNPQNPAVPPYRAGRDDCRVALIEVVAAALDLPVDDPPG